MNLLMTGIAQAHKVVRVICDGVDRIRNVGECFSWFDVMNCKGTTRIGKDTVAQLARKVVTPLDFSTQISPFATEVKIARMVAIDTLRVRVSKIAYAIAKLYTVPHLRGQAQNNFSAMRTGNGSAVSLGLLRWMKTGFTAIYVIAFRAAEFLRIRMRPKNLIANQTSSLATSRTMSRASNCLIHRTAINTLFHLGRFDLCWFALSDISTGYRAMIMSFLSPSERVTANKTSGSFA